ncbi:MAG: hypothetical protein ACOWWR_16550 [Eubacteriales bacterium]
MKSFTITDIDQSQIIQNSYDICFFASGFEPRATASCKAYQLHGKKIILYYELEPETGCQIAKENISYFKTVSEDIICIKSTDDYYLSQKIIEVINTIDANCLKVFVDYTSMSTTWYSTIFYILFNLGIHCEIDFSYTIGKHQEDFPPIPINDIVPLPGFSAVQSDFSYTSTVIMGLGFNSAVAEAIYDHMEPDELFTYIANPGAFENYAKRANDVNNHLISTYSNDHFDLPLRSVENSYRILAELVNYLSTQNKTISFVSLGPKPQRLTAMLICSTFTNASYLKTLGPANTNNFPEAIGEYVLTRVSNRKSC